MATNQENEFRPARKKINRLAKPFLAIKCQKCDLSPLFPSLRRISSNDIIREVRGSKSHTKKDFLDEASAAFQFPWYFGENWDAFEECINDLDWLPPVESYLLIISDADQLLLVEERKTFEILMDILNSASGRWESGANHDMLVRAYQEEVVPKSTKFTILLQYSSDAVKSSSFDNWLNESGISKVDSSIFDVNISDAIDEKPFHNLRNFVQALEPEYSPLMERLLQGEDVKREEISKLFRELENKILPYRNIERVTDPEMALLDKIIRDIGRQF